MICFQDSEGALQIALDSITNGDVLLVQTDTLFGLVCDATNEFAISKLFEIKGREVRKALPVFVESIQKAAQIVTFDDMSIKLANAFWPGALTMLLPIKLPSILPSVYFKEAVAVRVPRVNFILELLKAFGKPLTATSANLSGHQNSTTTESLMQDEISSMVSVIILDRVSVVAGHSTIVECINGEVRIIRDGLISASEIQRHL